MERIDGNKQPSWSKFRLVVLAACLLAILLPSLVLSQDVTIDRQGTLKYHPDSLGNNIPDFSRVGYFKGVRSIPTVPVIITLAPNGVNDMEAIQGAIDKVSQMPMNASQIRGAVLLQPGRYKIPGTIRISASGVVLRGSGEGSVLIATGVEQRNLIAVAGKGALKELPGSRAKITDNYVPVGTISFTVDDAKQFRIGDSIIVMRPGTAKWIHDLKMDEIEVRDSTSKQWMPNEYNLQFERVITEIHQNTIIIDNPIVMAMETVYGGGVIYKYRFEGRIENVGIENLVCESEYTSDTAEDHGWNAVHLNRIRNAWVRNVTSRYFGYSCVNIGHEASCITVDSCSFLQPKSQIVGGRRYSFNVDGQMNLVKNCFASEGRHDYVTGAQVCGPNVFYNCRSVNAKADIGPHHRWAVGTLFDNIVTDGEINIQDRGNWGTGHGWSGGNQVVWNCIASKAAIQDPWVSAKNYVFGLTASRYEGRLKGRPATKFQTLSGNHPKSLFMSQLREQRVTK